MFDAPTDRGGLEVLTLEESYELLRSVPVGRVAFVEGGEPAILPVNHQVDGRSIVFRSGYGSKLDAAWNEVPAAFEVDGWDDGERTGWSVLVRGTAEMVTDEDEIARLDEERDPGWVHEQETSTSWLRLRPNEVSGRRIVRLEV